MKGFAIAHRDLILVDDSLRFVRRRMLNPNKVSLVSGGGSGHEPLHIGFVGEGMLDAASVGRLFTSPSPDRVLAAVEAVRGRVGTLLLVKNYAGDVMNFEMARDLCPSPTEIVTIQDDVATAGLETGRRGVAGALIFEKIIGAAAEEGWKLGELKQLAAKLNGSVRTLGVALHPPMMSKGGSSFELRDDEVEWGVGIHGEKGSETAKYAKSDQLVERVIEDIDADLPFSSGQDYLLFVNGFGSATLTELHIVFRAACERLEKFGARVSRILIGNYVTSLDMLGFSLTLMPFDSELEHLWDARALTPSLVRA